MKFLLSLVEVKEKSSVDCFLKTHLQVPVPLPNFFVENLVLCIFLRICARNFHQTVFSILLPMESLYLILMFFYFFPQTLLTSETARIKDENGKTVLLLAAETGIITNSHYVVYIYCVDY